MKHRKSSFNRKEEQERKFYTHSGLLIDEARKQWRLLQKCSLWASLTFPYSISVPAAINPERTNISATASLRLETALWKRLMLRLVSSRLGNGPCPCGAPPAAECTACAAGKHHQLQTLELIINSGYMIIAQRTRGAEASIMMSYPKQYLRQLETGYHGNATPNKSSLPGASGESKS